MARRTKKQKRGEMKDRGRQEGSIVKDIFCSLSFKIKTKLGLLTRPIDFKPLPLDSDRPRAINGCYKHNISHKEHKCKVIQRK
jgi:hypothetical protein